jgi:hypothetical protein
MRRIIHALILLTLAAPAWAQIAYTPPIGYVPAGTGTETAKLGGVIHVDTTAASTLGTSEESLATFTLPANTLNADGKALRVTVWGTRTSNTNATTLRMRVGGTSGTITCSFAQSTAGQINWNFTLIIGRLSASSETWMCSNHFASGTTLTNGQGDGALSFDTAANADFVLRGITGVQAGNLTFRGWVFETLN